MLRLLSDRRHPARKNLLGGFWGFGLFLLMSGFSCFHFGEDVYRKNDIICRQKESSLLDGQRTNSRGKAIMAIRGQKASCKNICINAIT